jgi:hypothetical protein
MESSHASTLFKYSPCLIAFLFLIGCSTGYEKEANAVYYKSWNEGSGSSKYTLDADPQTFRVLKNSNYAKDKQKVFYKGIVIEGADATTFEALEEGYARDKNHGYYEKTPVISSKGQTFCKVPHISPAEG